MSAPCGDDYSDVYEERIRRARKVHRCHACGRNIPVGAYYCNVFNVFDGSADTTKRCGACEKTHAHLRELGRKVDMVPMDDLSCGLAYEEEWDGPPPPEIAALPFLTDAEAGELLKPGGKP